MPDKIKANHIKATFSSRLFIEKMKAVIESAGNLEFGSLTMAFSFSRNSLIYSML